MQAKGQNGTLLNETIQNLINTLPEDETISLFTNEKTFKNTSLKAIKNELIQLDYSPTQLNYDAAYFKGKTLFSVTPLNKSLKTTASTTKGDKAIKIHR
jgi:hypothetical protein